MTNIGELSVGISLDTHLLDRQIQSLGDRYSRSSLAVPVEFKQLDTKSLSVSIERSLSGVSDSFVQSLTKALEKNFQGNNSGLFSGLFANLTAPLGSVFTGAFEGIGRSVTQDVGKGISQGLQSQLGQTIGSFDLVGKKLGSSIGSGISGGLLSAEKSVQKNAEKIVRQLETSLGKKNLAKLFGENYKIILKDLAGEFSPQQIIASAIGSKDVLIASKSAKNDQQLRQKERIGGARVQLEREEKAANLAREPLKNSAREIDAEAMKVKEQVRELKEAYAELEAVSPNLSTSEISEYERLLREQATGVRLAAEEVEEAKKILSKEIEGVAQKAQVAGDGLNLLGRATPKAPAKAPLPGSKLYREIVAAVAQESGVPLDQRSIPQLTPLIGGAAGQGGGYRASENKIRVTDQTYQKLIAGKIEEITTDELNVVVHEIRHAVQAAFGQNNKFKTGKASIPLLRPNAEEIKQFATQIEASTAGINSKAHEPMARALEADAYTFAERKTAAIQERLLRPKLIEQLEQQVGIGGSKALRLLQRAGGKLEASSSFAKSYNLDVKGETAIALKAVQSAGSRLQPLIEKARNIDQLPLSEIQKLQQDFIGAIEENQQAFSIVSAFQKQVTGIVQRSQEVATQETNFPQKIAQFKEDFVQGKQLEEEILKASSQVEANIRKLEAQQKADLERANAGARSQITKGNRLKSAKASQETRSVEADVVSQAKDNQARITEALKNAFSGSGKNRKIIDEALASTVVSAISEQVAFLAKNIKNTELSGEVRQQLGRLRGTAEKQYRTYSPPLRVLQSQKINQAAVSNSNSRSVSQRQRGNSFDELAAFNINPEDFLKQEIARMQRLVKRPLNSARTVRNPEQLVAKVEAQLNRNFSTIVEASLDFKEFQPLIKRVETTYGKGFGLPKKMQQILGTIEKRVQKIEAVKVSGENQETYKNPGDFLSQQAQRLQRRVLRPLRSVQSRNPERLIAKVEEQLNRDLSTTVLASLDFQEFQPLIKRIEKKYGKGFGLPKKMQMLLSAIEEQIQEIEKIEINRENQLQQEDYKLLNRLEEKRGIEGNDRLQLVRDFSQPKQGLNLKQGIQSAWGDVQSSRRDRAIKQGAVTAIDARALEFDLRREAIISGKEGNKADAKAFKKLERDLRKVREEIEKILNAETVSPKDTQRLKALSKQAASTYAAVGKTAPLEQGKNAFLELFGGADKLKSGLLTLFKGFLAIQGLNNLSNLLSGLAQNSFETAVKFETLNNTLKFTSGGSAQAASALRFVSEEVARLNTPLVPAIEGFTKFSAAVKGTALERQARGIFSAVTQSVAVMGLSAEEAQGVYLALQQISAKGKVSAEEFRQQLAERLPMATAVASRALGVTTEEFSRMLDSGQLLSQDFLPRFANQLAAETKGGVAGAASTGQAAMNRLNNSITEFQLTIGKGALPAQKLGMNALSVVLEGVAENGEMVAQVLSGLTVVAIASLVPPVFALVKGLPLVKSLLSGLGTVGAGAAANLKLMALQFAAVLGAIELFKLGSRLMNGGELAKDFKTLETAALSAAQGIQELKAQTSELNAQEPPAANWSDSILLFLRNLPLLKKIPKELNIGGLQINPFKTFAEQDRDRAIESIYNAGGSISQAVANVRMDITKAGRNQGAIPLLKEIDDQLESVAERRRVLQGEIERNYKRLGLAVPPELRDELLNLSAQFQELSSQRVDIATPLTSQLTSIQRAVEEARAKLQLLETPEGQASFRGSNLAEIRAELERQIKVGTDATRNLEKLLQTAKADPVLALNESFRQLNVELGTFQERSLLLNSKNQAGILGNQLAGFSGDAFASQRAALANARTERDRLIEEMDSLNASLNQRQRAIDTGRTGALMAELGVSGNSSKSEIQSVLDTRSDLDEPRKRVLENLKAMREDEAKLSQSNVTLKQAELAVRQQLEAAATDNIAFNIQKRESLIKAESEKAIEVTRGLQLKRQLTEKEAGERIAAIALSTTKEQIKNADLQLSAYRTAHSSGMISARAFMEKESELVVQLSELKKQKIEQELALREAANQRILEGVERANRQAESDIAQFAAAQQVGIKKLQLAGELSETSSGTELSAIQVEQTDLEIQETKRKLAVLEALERQGVKTSADAFTERLQLQSQLGTQQVTLLDNQLQLQKNITEEELKNLQRIGTQKARALDEQIRGTERLYERQNAALELQQKEVGYLQQQDDLLKSITESRFNLAKSLSSASIATSEQSLESFNRGNQLFNRVISEDQFTVKPSDGMVRNLQAVASSQLQSAGFQVDFAAIRALKEKASLGDQAAQTRLNLEQVKFLERKDVLETKLQEKKLYALGLEQESARAMLEIDLRRQDFQSRSALFQAQQAQLQLAQSQQAALAEEKRAQLKKEQLSQELAITKDLDKRFELQMAIQEQQSAILDAQAKGSNARASSRLTDEMATLAQNALGDQKELFANARAAMEATQKNERAQFAAAEAARVQAGQLERAEVAAKRVAEQAERAAAASDGKSLTFKNLTEPQRRQLQSAERSFDRAQGDTGALFKEAMNRNPFFNLLLQQSGQGEIAEIANNLKGRRFQATAVANRAGMQGKDVMEELRKLNENVSRVASRPTTLNVNSNNPTRDAAAIYSDMGKNAARGANL